MRSNTDNDVLMLYEEVPETTMHDETSYISQFCKFEFDKQLVVVLQMLGTSCLYYTNN